MKRGKFRGLVLCGVIWATSAAAQAHEFSNDFGNIGLLQTPTARHSPAGEIRSGYSRTFPYDFIFLSAQPYDWLEATFRYSQFNNQPYRGDPDTPYLDKSFDFKIRLAQESHRFPEVSVGIQDFGGSGLLESEYLVASKRLWSLDITLGVGWGRLGARADFDNPMDVISNNFGEPRNRRGDGAGSISFSDFFKGESVGLFGGVRWQPEGAPYSIVVEREGNDYKKEPFGNDLDVSSPINVGANYRFQALDLGLAYERGNQLTFRASLAINLEQDHGPAKVFDPPPTPVGPPELAPQADPAAGEDGNVVAVDAEFVQSLGAALARQDFTLVAVDVDRVKANATIWFTQGHFRSQAQAVGRVVRAAASLAPPAYQTFTVVAVDHSIEHYRVTVNRKAIRETANLRISPKDLLMDTAFGPPRVRREEADFDGFVKNPSFVWATGPKLKQNIGDPNGFYYGQLWWSLSANLQMTDRLSFGAAVGFNIVNNFDEISRESDSKLPHVRSDIQKYLREGENNLVRLESNYIWPLAPDWYGRVSAGIFEEMYAGVAAEVLYRPFGRNWAAGVNINRVRQRDYEQRFKFLDYEVTTGHATLYYEIRSLDMRIIASVGRYLAGDYGGTLDLSREFSSGARVGIFATKTDVSAEEFGEGEFDKGFYISLPLDLFLPRSAKRVSTFAFRPLTRDGGQKVDDGRGLYGVTGEHDVYDMIDDWSRVIQ